MFGFFLRWLFAFALLAVTFNPTRWNYTRWAMENYQSQLSVTVLAGLILFIGYIIYLRATLRSIGGLGMFLVAAVVGALIWVLIDWGILALGNRDQKVWLGLLALSVVLGIGLSWSFARRAMSGQFDVDETDE
ncbi:DUF6524 family protein [Pseudogemmobacter sp. W21_MBD1_M6]|uniref:DUF6524 family protein n=1 Tax=Pseudogemmobacter sp. W21_MBD1_M6 TaxID=3240271 RepID=UPI003F9AAD00